MNDVLKYLLSGATVGGLIIWLFKLYFESQIKIAQKEKEERDKKLKLIQEKKENREIEFRKISSDYDHAVGRFIFWIFKGLRELDPNHDYFNGELTKAYDDFQNAEKKIKDFEQQIIAEHNT